MTVYAHDGSDGRTNRFPDIEARHGEDPARFLEANKDLALARIHGIRDVELLQAFRAVEKQITDGGRSDVLEAIAERERELTGEDPIPEVTADQTPVPATDGGTELEYDETEDVDETDEPEPEQIHPDARGLETGEVLVVDRGEKIEYVFPTNAKSDSPYISRAYEVDTHKLWMELKIDEDDYRSRMAKDPDHESIDEIDVEVPRKAATGGGE